jgi:hypothetical protein
MAGKASVLSAEPVDHEYLTAAQVRRRYGGISHMGLHRWLKHPRLNFPQPTKINGRRYFLKADLDAFDARQAAARARQAA